MHSRRGKVTEKSVIPPKPNTTPPRENIHHDEPSENYDFDHDEFSLSEGLDSMLEPRFDDDSSSSAKGYHSSLQGKGRVSRDDSEYEHSVDESLPKLKSVEVSPLNMGIDGGLTAAAAAAAAAQRKSLIPTKVPVAPVTGTLPEINIASTVTTISGSSETATSEELEGSDESSSDDDEDDHEPENENEDVNINVDSDRMTHSPQDSVLQSVTSAVGQNKSLDRQISGESLVSIDSFSERPLVGVDVPATSSTNAATHRMFSTLTMNDFDSDSDEHEGSAIMLNPKPPSHHGDSDSASDESSSSSDDDDDDDDEDAAADNVEEEQHKDGPIDSPRRNEGNSSQLMGAPTEDNSSEDGSESQSSWVDKNQSFASEVDRVIGVVQEKKTGRLRIPSKGGSDDSVGSVGSFLSDLSLVEPALKGAPAFVNTMALAEFSSASESDDDEEDLLIVEDDENEESDADSDDSDDDFMNKKRQASLATNNNR